MFPTEKLRNLAIVAHIDHGKTTLIDSIFKSVHTFRDNARVEERVMDNNEIEKERGITIRAKHCTVDWRDYRINIIDTPGHADFSGEVERVLSMVDSVLLLVDANEGPMPQTRYVLMRALRLGLKPIVVVNKVDRPNADPPSALNKTFDLFLELGANDEQAEFPVLYGSGLNGWLVKDLEADPRRDTMDPLFETIIEHVAPPNVDQTLPFLMQVCTLGWKDHIGRIGCGRVLQGVHKKGEEFIRTSAQWVGFDRTEEKWEITNTQSERSTYLWGTRGLDEVVLEEVGAGDIVWIAGPKDILMGDTFSSPLLENPALKPLEIEEPTVSMFFLVNSGPLSGKEGRAVTLRQVKDRLEREMRVNVAMRMEDIGRSDGVKVSGRGELHLAILIEEMRREGFEMCVSRPEIITQKDANGATLEPMEELIIDLPGDYQGIVIEKLARRKGEMVNMQTTRSGMLRMEFNIPTRGLIGYRNDFLTDTRGMGIMASRFVGYGPWCGEVVSRNRGSMVSMDTGDATSYSLENLQERGTMFVGPMDPVYGGMIIGENSRPGDLPCNPTKKKALTNHRSANKDQTLVLDVPRRLTLDTALEWIAPDELVEVTPKSIRVRKAVLDAEERKRIEKRTASLAG